MVKLFFLVLHLMYTISVRVVDLHEIQIEPIQTKLKYARQLVVYTPHTKVHKKFLRRSIDATSPLCIILSTLCK
jgi:hypothetical protein